MDIVLGSFRYVINNPKNPDAARDMFKKVGRMMWAITEGNTRYVNNRGLIIRPPIQEIRVQAYRAQYEQLLEHLSELANG
jgi:hypothetical protein